MEKWTITFREDVRGWVSFKSFFYENAISMGSNYYTFVNGDLYQHHIEKVFRNTFYPGSSSQSFVSSSVKVIMNSSPGIVKAFNTLNYEGSQSKTDKLIEYQVPGDTTWYTNPNYYNLSNKEGWYVRNIKTDLQNGSVPEFIEKEGKWFNYIKGINIETTINGIVTGNLDPNEFSFQGLGWVDGINTYVAISGCTNPNYIQYNPLANIDDGSCTTLIVTGCMNPSAVNFGCPTGSNSTIPCPSSGVNTPDPATCIIYGCTNPTMFNYNPLATIDDGSCVSFVYGCTISASPNYDALANTPCNGTIPSPCTSTTNPACAGPALTWQAVNQCCTSGIVYGCMDDGFMPATYNNNQGGTGSVIPGTAANNHNLLATVDDTSCLYEGCAVSTAWNYCPNCNSPGWCCITDGCRDSGASNYDALNCADCAGNMPGSTAYTAGGPNGDDTCCIQCVYGCTDSSATNYNSSATCNATALNPGTGVCTYAPINGCMDASANNFNAIATSQPPGSCNYCLSPIGVSPLSNVTSTSVDLEFTSALHQNSTSPNNAVLENIRYAIREQQTGSVTWESMSSQNPNLWAPEPCSPVTGANNEYDPWTPGGVGLWCFHNIVNYSSPITISGLVASTNYEIKVEGLCINENSSTYDPLGSTHIFTFSTQASATIGCTDPTACNHDPNATVNTGCVYINCAGCMDPSALNHNQGNSSPNNATGDCTDMTGTVSPCTIACDHSTPGTGCCTYAQTGCMDTSPGLWGDVNGNGLSGGSCWGSNTAPLPVLINPAMHPDSNPNGECVTGSGLAAGYSAQNYDPANTSPGVGGNRSNDIRYALDPTNWEDNGCNYVEGCMDNGYITDANYVNPNVPTPTTYTHGSLVPTIAAWNLSVNNFSGWMPFVSPIISAGIDDGSCAPAIVGCMNEYSNVAVTQTEHTGNSNLQYPGFHKNWNVGRGCPSTIPSGQWVAPRFMDIPYPGYESRRDSNTLIPFEDVNIHQETCCIQEAFGCASENSSDTWKHGRAGRVYRHHYIDSNSVGQVGIHSWRAANSTTFPSSCPNPPTPWDEKQNRCFPQEGPAIGVMGTQGGQFSFNTVYGAYNYYSECANSYFSNISGNNGGEGATLPHPSTTNYDFNNIVQPWSPVNMDSCCQQAGCLHPAAYNFDLIGYVYMTTEDPTWTGGVLDNPNWWKTGYPTQTDPWAMKYQPQENQHSSCAFCNGVNAEDGLRHPSLHTSPYPGADPSIWDGSQGYSAFFKGLPSNSIGGTGGVYDESHQLFGCCCWHAGCTHMDADNFDGIARCDDGSCCSNTPSLQILHGWPACGVIVPPGNSA